MFTVTQEDDLWLRMSATGRNNTCSSPLMYGFSGKDTEIAAWTRNITDSSFPPGRVLLAEELCCILEGSSAGLQTPSHCFPCAAKWALEGSLCPLITTFLFEMRLDLIHLLTGWNEAICLRTHWPWTRRSAVFRHGTFFQFQEHPLADF